MNRFALLLTLLPTPLFAQSELSLLPGWRTEAGTQVVGVAIALDPGWKTYWRVPGAGGIPPLFDWSGSANLADVRVIWPRPEVFETYGMLSFGYDGVVVLPVEVTPQDPTAPLDLALTLDYGICADVCVPATSSAALPAGTPETLASGFASDAALSDRVMTGTEAGVALADCRLAAPDRLVFDVHYQTPPLLAPMPVLETGREDVMATPESVSFTETGFVVEAQVHRYGNAPLPDLGALRVTLLGAFSAAEISGCPPG